MPDILYSVFWLEVDKIKPNPFQPRREFNEDRLRDLANSIRQYGVLQPLVVSKKEIEREDGGLYSEYELIAGERRWRASKLAGVSQVPCVIRADEESDRLKLEMAIIENLQREDLNPVDRARAFQRLIKEFNLRHHDIADKVGKSRVYVTNTLRILSLPEDFLEAITAGKINEGHTRPLLMLSDRPIEQRTLFDEIVTRQLTVRESEVIARRLAEERARPRPPVDPSLLEIEKQLSDRLGAKVQIERRAKGGKLTINYLSKDDLEEILRVLNVGDQVDNVGQVEPTRTEEFNPQPQLEPEAVPKSESEDNLYDITNFSI